MPEHSESLLTPADAGRFLGFAVQTLARLRSEGGGPPYCKLVGRVRYKKSTLLKWADDRERRSTSEAKTPRTGAAAERGRHGTDSL